MGSDYARLWDADDRIVLMVDEIAPTLPAIDARLIAAAPELLRLVASMLMFVDCNHCDSERELVEQARALMARIDGGE